MVSAATFCEAQDLQLNDREYFERQGVNVLVFSNSFNGGFNDEKNSGIEIIHHGVRTVQGGAVRLNKTPEQWDLVPKMTSRKVNRENGSIEVGMRYDDYDFDSRVVVTAKGKAVEIAVWLDKPVPEKLAGDAGFNLEFLPSQYWLKTYTIDGRLGRLPRYATSQTITRPNSEKPRQFKGFKTYDDRGTNRFVDPLPIEKGHRITLATDTPERLISISSDDAELELYDGRMLAQNGWFVLHSVLPKGKTGKVITWTVEPNAIEGWIREPNIGFSQVGYIPSQPKVAVIELDKNDRQQPTAKLMRIGKDGSAEQAFQGEVKSWGPFYKYNYVKFDFSSVKEPGVYYIQYGNTRTNNFLIDEHVYIRFHEIVIEIVPESLFIRADRRGLLRSLRDHGRGRISQINVAAPVVKINILFGLFRGHDQDRVDGVQDEIKICIPQFFRFCGKLRFYAGILRLFCRVKILHIVVDHLAAQRKGIRRVLVCQRLLNARALLHIEHEVHISIPQLLGSGVEILSGIEIRFIFGRVEVKQIVGQQLFAQSLRVFLFCHGRDFFRCDTRIQNVQIHVQQLIRFCGDLRFDCGILFAVRRIHIHHVICQDLLTQCFGILRGNDSRFRRRGSGYFFFPLSAKHAGIRVPKLLSRGEDCLLLIAALCLVGSHDAGNIIQQHLLTRRRGGLRVVCIGGRNNPAHQHDKQQNAQNMDHALVFHRYISFITL